MTVLIIAASKSDVETMKKAADELATKGIHHEMRVCSAHRTPEMLDKMLSEKDYDAIIAAAGLAAALPGVVAAKTTAPVIGVPLSGAFEGLDALLSIIQMPPGIPVLSTGVNNAEEAAEAAIRIIKNAAKKINMVAAHDSKAIAKAADTAKRLGIPHSNTSEFDKNAVNICFIDLNEKEAPVAANEMVIYCPTAEKETAADAAKLLRLTMKGLWVGLNRGENAVLAAAEIMKMSGTLKEYRQDMRLKVEEADREVNEKGGTC